MLLHRRRSATLPVPAPARSNGRARAAAAAGKQNRPGRSDLDGRDHEPADREAGGRVSAGETRRAPRPGERSDGFPDAAPDAVLVSDRDGLMVRVNARAEALFGYPRRALLGREVETLFPDRFREELVGHRAASVADPDRRPSGADPELCGRHQDGREFPVELELRPVATAAGTMVAYAIRDVAGHRQAEAGLRRRVRELEDAARHNDELLGALAHELRSPLAAIRNAVAVAKLCGPPDANLRSAADVIGRQSDHMARLVEDLLDAARMAHGKVRLRTESVDLGRVVGQAVEACRPLLTARRQHLTVSLPPAPVRLTADPTRLAQVLTNLLTNAAKYTDDGGRIWLTAAADGGEAEVRVRDTGIGIPAAMLPRVFDLFAQVPGALDRSDGGLGIGLALVGRLVRLHGGTVRALSDGPDRGSEFVVRLPLRPATDAGGDRPVETTGSPSDPSPVCNHRIRGGVESPEREGASAGTGRPR